MANQQHWTQIALNDPDIKSWYDQLRFDHPNEPENVLLHMANSIQNYGSGSGNGFDYKTAIESGIKPELQPDGKYHWLGETPDKILKGPNHPTRSLTDQSRVEQTIQANKGRVDQRLQLAETQKEVKTNLVELVQQYPEARNVIMSMVKDGVHDIGTIAKLAREEVQKKRPESLVPKTKWEKLKTSFSRGKQNIAMDLLWFEFMTGTGKLGYKDLAAMTDEFEKQQAADPINADGWVEEILIPTANFAPSMWASIKEGFKGAAMGGGAAAAYTALTPIPDELIAVPTFMATGAQANVAKFWYMQGAGSIYRDQVRKGVNEDVASFTASIGALPYAMIESISMKGLIPVSLKKEFVDVIAGGVATGLKKVGEKAGAEYLKQVGQEVAQEVTLIASEETATWLNNKIMDGSIPQAEGQEMLSRLRETFVESAKGLIIPVGLGGGVSAAKVITDADAKKKSEALVEEQVALDSMSPERAQLTKVEKEENRETQPTAKLEVQAALESEEISPGSASIANYLLDQDPEFDSRASLEISNEVLQMNDDYIINVLGKDPEQFYEEEGITKEEAESGEYFATGSTTVDFQKNATRTAIKLYKGHDADTIVEEFYHDFYEHMPEKDRKSFAKYHEESGDTRSIEEHFGQEGRDYFFSEGMHEKAGGIREVFDWIPGLKDIKQTLTDLIARIRKIRGAKIPKRIQNLYTKAGTRQLKPLTAAQKKKIKVQKAQFQLRQKPKSKEFKKWFGDSKVVDEKGQPLVVYHGTNRDFDSFKLDANEYDKKQFGFHFGPVEQANARLDYLTETNQIPKQGLNIKPVYLSINNPIRLPDIAQWNPGEVANTLDKLYPNEFGTLYEELVEFEIPGSPLHKSDYDYDFDGNLMYDDQTAYIRDKIKEKGYDGIVYSNQFEGVAGNFGTSIGRTAKTLEKFGEDSYIAFEPSQIKGQFNPKPDKASPKIMHQVKKKTAALRLKEKPRSKEFQDWFKGSEVKENGKPMVMYHGTAKNIDSFNQMSYFTPSPNVANYYARDHRGYSDDPGTKKDAQVYPVYLNIKNPLDIRRDPLDAFKTLDLGINMHLDDWLVTLNEFLTDHKKEKLTKEEDQQITNDFVKEVANEKHSNYKMDSSGFTPKAYATINQFPIYNFIDNNIALMNALKARGFDGIVASEDIMPDYAGSDKVYIAFNPNQIKGQFNPKPDKASPKIMFQVKKKPKQQPGGKPFEQWSPITDKEAKNSPRLEIFQHLQKKNTFLTNNPLDRGMVMVGNIGQLELQDQGTYPFRKRNEGKKTVKLSAIMAFDKGQGNGNKLLEMLKEAADETGTIIEGYAKQIGIEGPNTDELAKWYNRKGFNLHKFNDYFDIEYIPEQLKDKTIEISELTLKDFEKDSELAKISDEIIYENKEYDIEITHRRDINEWSVFDLEKNFTLGDFTSKEEALEEANAYIEDKSFVKELDRKEQIEKGDLIPGKKPVKLSGKMKKIQFQLKRVGTTKQFVGFPKGINTRSKLSTLRKRVEELADQGEVGKNWYDNSAQAALDLAGGDMKQAELILDLIAVTSAGMPVKSNTGQAVKLMYQIAQGDIKGAGRFPARVEGWVKALAEGKNLKESINDAKLISFAENLKRSLTNADDNRVTVDVWMMRAYGFPNEVPTGAQYKTVAEDVRRIATKRGWTPKQTQAAIWVGAKARWETINGNKMPLKKALRLMKSTPASQERLDIAKVDYADAMKIYEGRISFEFIPSTRSDILPGIHEASYEQKMEYHKDMSEVITDDKGKNIIAKELKIPEVRSLDGPGFWEGAVSPSKQVEVLVPSIASAKDIKDKIDPNFFKTIDVHNSIVGLLFHQDAIGSTKELKPQSLKQANAVGLVVKEGLTTEEFRSVNDQLGDDFGIMPTNYGGIVVNFADENGNPFSGIDNNTFYKKVKDAAESALEGSDKTIHLQRAQSIGKLTEDYSNGKDYRRRISESGQRNAATRVFNQVSGDIQKINERYSKKYGWGNPGKSQKVVFAVRPKRLIPKQKTPKQLAGPDSNFGIELDPENYTQLFNRKIVDKMNRLGYVMDKFKEVREISDEEDAYLAQELYIGKTRELMDRFEEDIFGREDSLLPRIIKAGYSMEDFGSYLHARHALERNEHVAKINEDLPDGGSGMTNDQAKEILKQYKGDKKIEAFAKEFYRKVTKRGLRMRLNSGLIDRKTYDYLNDYYKDYVPLFVIKDVENRTIVGKGFSTPQGSELKRVKGSAKVRGNPVFSAIYEMMGVMRRSEKNKVAAKFLNLAEEMQSESWKIEKMRYRPQFNKDGEVEFMQPQFKMDDNILAVRRDGDLYLITIEDEALASGLKNLGAEKTYKYLNQANAYIRSIVTTFNPEFIVTNFFRDIQTALVHLGGEYDGVAKTAAANVTKAMGGVWKNVRGDRTAYWSKMYDELKKEGGKVGWFDMASLDEHQEKVEKALKNVEDGKGGVVQAGKDFLELIEQANEAVESGIRLATYEALIKKGLSKKKAAQAAKNITVNFNKKGEWSTLFNTFYLFFNATVQGNARIAKSIINSKKTRMIVGGMVANSMIWSLRNYHMNDEEWEKKNHWEKDNYLMWMNRDGTAYKVKVPYGYNIFHVAGQAIADGIHQTKKNGAKYVDYIGLSSRVLKAASDAVSPFGDGSLLQAISPTVLDPIVQLAENKNFAGTPFMKPKYYDRSKPNFSNYYEKNPPSWVSRWTTESLSLISGGRRYKGLIKKRDGTVQDHTIPGVIDVNPDALDHIFGFLTGGTGKFFQRSFDLGMNFSQNKSTEVSKIPFIRQFYSKPDLTGATEKRLIFKMKYEAKHTIYNHVEVSKFKKYVHDAIKFGALAEKDIKLVKDHNGKMVPKIINDFLKHQRLARGEAEPTKKKKRKVVL